MVVVKGGGGEGVEGSDIEHPQASRCFQILVSALACSLVSFFYIGEKGFENPFSTKIAVPKAHA